MATKGKSMQMDEHVVDATVFEIPQTIAEAEAATRLITNTQLAVESSFWTRAILAMVLKLLFWWGSTTGIVLVMTGLEDACQRHRARAHTNTLPRDLSYARAILYASIVASCLVPPLGQLLLLIAAVLAFRGPGGTIGRRCIVAGFTLCLLDPWWAFWIPLPIFAGSIIFAIYVLVVGVMMVMVIVVVAVIVIIIGIVVDVVYVWQITKFCIGTLIALLAVIIFAPITIILTMVIYAFIASSVLLAPIAATPFIFVVGIAVHVAISLLEFIVQVVTVRPLVVKLNSAEATGEMVFFQTAHHVGHMATTVHPATCVENAQPVAGP